MDRRQFLKMVSAGAVVTGAAPCVAPLVSFAAAPGSVYRNLLILIELKGGNDGLNSVIPFDNPAYYKLRPRLAIARDQVLQLGSGCGLHPQLAKLKTLWDKDELAIVQGLGYPHPNLSHFRSHLGEPTAPPRIAPARGPPLWEAADAKHDPATDPLLQRAPAFAFDQRLTW